MDYSGARAAFFSPRAATAAAGSPSGLAGHPTPARSLRDAIEPLATICFWAEPAYDSYARAGLDFLGGYVWGRASVLGEPEPPVVAAAFGVFEPGLVAGLYDSARAACGLEQVRAAKEAGAVESLRQVLGEPAELPDAVAALRRAAAAADPTGRPMHAGATALPWPQTPLGQLWHACTLLREHRGDGHLAACVGEGLSGLEANLLTEMAVGWEPLTYTASRGWSPEAMALGRDRLAARGLADGERLTADGRALRGAIEERTDRLVHPSVEALGEDLPGLVALLDDWSGRVVEHGWFPPDPYKRASG